MSWARSVPLSPLPFGTPDLQSLALAAPLEVPASLRATMYALRLRGKPTPFLQHATARAWAASSHPATRERRSTGAMPRSPARRTPARAVGVRCLFLADPVPHDPPHPSTARSRKPAIGSGVRLRPEAVAVGELRHPLSPGDPVGPDSPPGPPRWTCASVIRRTAAMASGLAGPFAFTASVASSHLLRAVGGVGGSGQRRTTLRLGPGTPRMAPRVSKTSGAWRTMAS